jgi:hypothetical protein
LEKIYNMPELLTTTLYNDANLISYWRLNSDLVDEKSAYNLGTSSAPTDVVGIFGNGKHFTRASSQYANIAKANCTNLEISGSQTWVAWVNLSSLPGAEMALMGKSDAGATGWAGLFIGTDSKPGFNLNGLTTTPAIYADNVIPTTQWVFLAGVYDSANTKIKIWVNNVKKEATASGSHTNSNGDFALGILGSYSGHWYLDGTLDDCSIFNRALTDNEILTLYEERQPSFLLNLAGNFKNN